MAPQKAKPTPSRAPQQEQFYLEKEADAWFRRTGGDQVDDGSAYGRRKERFLAFIRETGIKPKTVGEVGGSTGHFANAFQKEFGCKMTLVEPSAEAVAYAKKHYPNISAVVGAASRLPFEDGSLDALVFKGVLCWVGREVLLKAMAEADRVLAPGGHLIINDYFPDAPRRTRNHHVKDRDIFCFKTDHAAMFMATGLYSAVATNVYVDPADAFPGSDIFDSRQQASVLRKSYSDYYGEHSPHL